MFFRPTESEWSKCLKKKHLKHLGANIIKSATSKNLPLSSYCNETDSSPNLPQRSHRTSVSFLQTVPRLAYEGFLCWESINDSAKANQNLKSF